MESNHSTPIEPIRPVVFNETVSGNQNFDCVPLTGKVIRVVPQQIRELTPEEVAQRAEFMAMFNKIYENERQ